MVEHTVTGTTYCITIILFNIVLGVQHLCLHNEAAVLADYRLCKMCKSIIQT